MSASSEYEPAARQDYGPTTSTENIYEHVLDHKLTESNMSIPNMRTPVFRATPVSPSEGDPEPDSTNPESIIQSIHDKADKEVEYHISERKCDSDISMDPLSGIVKIGEPTVDPVGHITYPIIQDADDSSDGNYVENAATIIQAPLNTAIVQNVTKLPQNFTINVDAAVGNIATIQNLSQDVSGGQTLWLPTILATSATTESKSEDDRSQASVSQIIITSESYVSDASQLGRRGNIVTDTGYINRPKSSKVQILSNIPIPKNANYSQPYITNSKELPSPVYGTQNHVYKLSTNVVPQKHMNNSVLCTKPPKSQSLIGCSNMSQSVVNNSPVKNVSYSHTFTKSTNLNKTLSKVNNGANLNAMVAASTGNAQCHILSRVVSGPNKMSVHSGRKSVNSFKGSKNSSQVSSQKNQSRAIKIIQQTGSVHKSEGKTWPVASVATYKSQQSIYGVVDANTSKIIQKVGSPPHKSQQPLPVSKFPAKGERLVLQSPCGPVLLSTAPISTSLPKGPHYVQSGATPNLRYVHTYGATSEQLTSTSQVSANQQLTAQILQSLSQPKLMFQPSPNTINQTLVPPPPAIIEEMEVIKPVNQKRIVFGDKSTLLTADDIIGMEERPNLVEELRRYSFQSLAFVMLDHTYALPVQKQPSPTTPTSTTPAPIVTQAIMSPTQITTPMSPIKRTSPVIMSTAAFDLPISVPSTIVAPPAITSIPVSAITYKPETTAPIDDDAASAISSLDGGEPGPRGGSDTETAPEGEEEGKTRCICEFTHDDGYMICCDRCGEWQHVDCMGIDRQNIPDAYMCEICQPRAIDRRRAKHIQLRKREELSALAASDSDSEGGRPARRLLTVTTYTDTRGASVTTYNSTPALPTLPPPTRPTLPLPKRGPKRPKKADVVRKTTKRKLAEKRVKRKKEMLMNRSKYTSSMTSQSHWQDSFEQAMTNHYSPELRAKIMKYASKLGNTANMASAITAHLCTTVPHAGGKILIATKDLKENTPIIELRGKYMLSNQHRPQVQNSSRAGSQKPGPFVFFYRLPKDNTQICIDTRTYGNEARFVRRSCKPNAELQHCIVKGALHVYLVTIGVIPSNTEITVGHDNNGAKQPCACGNPKHCKVNGLTSLAARKSLDYPPREKRSRNRCSSSTSSPASPPPVPLTPVKEPPPPITPVKSEKSPIKHEFAPLSPIKSAVVALNFDQPMKAEMSEIKSEIDLIAKEEMKPEIDEPDFAKIEQPAPVVEPELLKEEIEEKEEPAKEEPAKEEPPVEEPKVEEEEREEIKEVKAEEPILSDEEKFEKVEEVKEKPEKEKKLKEEPKIEDERPATREYTAKSACHDRSARTSRAAVTNQDSLDDKTDDSQDKIQTKAKEKEKRKMTREERKMEAIMKAFERMEKAEQRKQEVKERQKRRESDPHPNATEKDEDDDHCTSKKRKKRKGRARTTSQSNRRRLNSADSDMVTSGDEAAPPRTPPPPRALAVLPPATDTSQPDARLSEDLGLSSACLLVEAAVGSVESAFKLPKTKKTIATEWVGRSPERTPSPYRSPYRPTLVSAPSLESLVRVASTMIGDLSGQDLEHEEENAQQSPPRTPSRDRSRPPKKAKRITRNTPPTDVVEIPPTIIPQHSAKKRWLRQAISEESDSPNAESPPNEMVTPLKKRRLARESLSCEPNTIVPVSYPTTRNSAKMLHLDNSNKMSLVQCNDETSPVLTSDDSPVKDEQLNANRQYKVQSIMESIYGRDRTRSDSGQGSDDQCNMDNDVLNVNIKGVSHDSEHIRRIIGVPTPEEEYPPDIPRPDDVKTNNNNIEEDSGYNKVVPMEIDHTTIPQPKIELNESSISDLKGIESPNEKLNSCQSADTSGNSSPQRDEMDDIQKKIHSFHTENILILKSRNKKPPKEKRKKVNLNFDLNMVDDQISIQLRTDDTNSSEVNGDIHDEMGNAMNEDAKLHVSPENIPLPPTVETVTLPAPENIPLPQEPSPVPVIPPPEAIPLPMEEPVKPAIRPVIRPTTPTESKPEDKPFTLERPSVLDNAVPFSSRFSSTGLFSGIFSNMSQSFNLDTSINENVPNMSIIKSAIDRTTSFDSGLFDKDSISPADELKSVQEILTRVNNMDSNNSVLLSGVLKSSNNSSLLSPKPAAKPYCPRANDPRLNPPPVEKPKPVRRKLSITEYRKRHLAGCLSEDSSQAAGGAGGAAGSGGVEGDGGDSCEGAPSHVAARLSPQRLEAAAAAAVEDLEERLHRDLSAAGTALPKGVLEAGAGASAAAAASAAAELRREKLSSRLRREFGLALADDEDARHPHEHDLAAPTQGEGGGVGAGGAVPLRCDR